MGHLCDAGYSPFSFTAFLADRRGGHRIHDFEGQSGSHERDQKQAATCRARGGQYTQRRTWPVPAGSLEETDGLPRRHDTTHKAPPTADVTMRNSDRPHTLCALTERPYDSTSVGRKRRGSAGEIHSRPPLAWQRESKGGRHPAGPGCRDDTAIRHTGAVNGPGAGAQPTPPHHPPRSRPPRSRPRA